MYRFIDVTEIQDEFFTSPDSFTINGVLPESKILGYHTLNVSGREMLTSEVGEKDISHADGTIYLYKRDLPRELVVTYQLIAPTPEEFMRRFNALCAMLNDEQMQIIFNDETDKYFTATKSSVELPEPGRLAVTGTYTLYCTDPYKYALEQKGAVIENGKSEINYMGTKEYPMSFYLASRSDETITSAEFKIIKGDDVLKTFKIQYPDGISLGNQVYMDFENVDFRIKGEKSWQYVTLDSQSITLIPGKQTFLCPGFEGIIIYRERWL